PFCGYHNSYLNINVAIAASAPAEFVPLPGPFGNYVLVWDSLQGDINLPGIASPGMIVGQVLQIAPQVSGQTTTTFQQDKGTITIFLDSNPNQVAIYDGKCATFSLFDPQLSGGTRKLTANDGTTTLHALANEVNGIQVDDATYLIYLGLERQYRNIGRVTFTFPPPTPPPPPPQVDIRMFTLNQNNIRVPARGIVQAGVPLVIALKTLLTVTSGTVGGLQLSAASPDHLDSTKDTSPTLDARVYDPSSADQTYTPTTPGAYTLTVTALAPLGGPAIHVSKSFLVVTAGGDNTHTTQGQAPTVIANDPQILAKRVPVTIFPSVTFSEPVTNVADNVTLTDSGGNSARVRLVGVRPDGSVANPVNSSDVITAVTVQPLTALKFSTDYTLTVTAAIEDQNNPPLRLGTPFTVPFTTVGPQKIDASGDRYGSTRPLVIGKRAYIGEPAGAALSDLVVVNIDDPSSPGPPIATNYFPGRVTDISGQESSPITRCLTEQLPGNPCPMQGSGGPLVALSATVGATDFVIPSNIWFYDVSDPDKPKRVGAVSATSSATQDGTVTRIFMKDQFIYTATAFKGLQVIDIQQAINEFQATAPNVFGGSITTEGNGFALDAVVNTIPVSLPLPGGSGNVTTFQAIMTSVKAADYPTAAPDPNNPSAPVPTHTYIVATGRLPLVVADPVQSSLNAVVFPLKNSNGLSLQDKPLIDGTTGQFTLTQGTSVALGSVPRIDALGNAVNEPVAVIVGFGKGVPMLGVVNMTDPRNPQTQGFVPLLDKLKRPVGPVDVILKDSLAVVGTSLNEVLLVDLTDPNNPLVAGEIDGITSGANQVLGDRLALTDDGVLITSSFNSAIGGIHAATFGSQCASFRATLKNNPPSQTPFTDVMQYGWKVSGGFNQTPEGVALNHDGLVLNDIFLGRRQMAKAMSLPYFLLQRQGPSGIPLRCMLYTSNNDACTGVAPGVNARSHLLKYSASPNIFTDHFEYKAQYVVDFLDGDPDTDPDIPDSCVLITQQYEFYKEGLKPLEPFGFFPSALFRPLVKYTYYTDAGGPQLNYLQAPQRMHFDARTPDQPTPTIASQKAKANDTMLACDVDTDSDACGVSPPPLDKTILEHIHYLGMLHNQSPLPNEEYLTIIANGKNNIITDPVPRLNAAGLLRLAGTAISLQLDLEEIDAGEVTVGQLLNTVYDFVKTIDALTSAFQPLALPQFNTTILDNFHQNPTPSGNPTQPPDEPTATAFGCPACVHVHWRWSKNLTSDSPVQFVIHVDPTFDNNQGNLRIPPNSNQDVDIAILRAGGPEEQQPLDVNGLFAAQKQQSPLGPSIDARDLVNAGTTPVFWYIGKGRQNSETFFSHGLGFGTFYANRVSVSTTDQHPISVNVEHTRTVNYTVSVTRLGITGSLTLVLPTLESFGPFKGTLPAGTDDIPNATTDLSQWFSSNVGFDASTIAMWVTIQLDDPELQTTVPKFTWKKTFTFTPGDVVDPATGDIIREP
ncbi:MAG TPA: Ig-like domain-containing protein, partial [Candidatus Angelobacter sp.]